MFNGKRSHSLIGVLATVCAYYITRLKRPSWPVLFATSFTGALVVTIAIGWRNNADYEFSMAGFTQYLSEFKPERILENLNIEDQDNEWDPSTRETTEYGGFLLMMDTVPEKVGLRLRRELHPNGFHVHPPNPLAHQASLRPRAVGGRLDGGLGDGAGRRLHQPGHRHSGGDPAQRRRRGNG